MSDLLSVLNMQEITLAHKNESSSGPESKQNHRLSQPLSTQEIRNRFVTYYQSQGFQPLPRASLLHPSIPMSFVMSAGLAQVEMALSLSPSSSGQKFVLVQDCFRHFDLDKVGLDDTHLSLFEMPGAFVFGANAQKDTIERMWKLATREFQIDPERLWVSYFAGGNIVGHTLSADQETYIAWCSVGVPPQRLVGLGVADNYWRQSQSLGHMVGQPRKCGPNTELFYDLGIQKSCNANCLPGCSCGRFLEFSNSLFITHEVEDDTGLLAPLSTPFTETVIGSERMATILQNVSSVFETIQYSALTTLVNDHSLTTDLPVEMVQASERIIVDHVKALCFLVADGAPPPGKNGRERIIKLLIRRTIARMQVLGISETHLWSLLVATVVEKYELTKLVNKLADNKLADVSLIEEIMAYVSSESKRFHATIQRVYQKMAEIFPDASVNQPEEQMIELEKNWGLSFPLMVMWLRDKKIPFSIQKYSSALAKWRSKHIQHS
ncbi:MAG: alanine--tRNA ligase-related protein [Leptolyngbyaceae cyanobacterium MO_188.B28]|nr:alanine--tRNA ligase-related protein [Leptolyngbyaceae cyanobacterium MO_188.B28]